MKTKQSVKSVAESTEIEMQTVRLYQPVEFDRKPYTYFNTARPDMKNVRMVYSPATQLITISQPGVDFIFVGLTNLAYMRPVDAECSVDQSIETSVLSR